MGVEQWIEQNKSKVNALGGEQYRNRGKSAIPLATSKDRQYLKDFPPRTGQPTKKYAEACNRLKPLANKAAWLPWQSKVQHLGEQTSMQGEGTKLRREPGMPSIMVTVYKGSPLTERVFKVS